MKKLILIYSFLALTFIKVSGQDVSTVLDSVVYKWKKDSTGCLHIRSFRDGKLLIEKYTLIGKTISEIEPLLGMANLSEYHSDKLYLTYYIGGACDTKGAVNTNADFCYFQIILYKGKLISTNNSCI